MLDQLASTPHSRGLHALALCALVTAGCNMNKMGADMAGNMAVASTPHMRGFWDYDLAGQANAAGIVQLEAMHSLSPDNEDLTLTLAKSYLGYGFGWLEVEIEEAEQGGDYDRADHLRERAALLYERGRNLALRAMRERDDGIDAALAGKPAALAKYLDEEYDDPEDAAPVFWLASCWGAFLNMTSDLSLAIDLPLITTLAKHVIKLDPGFEHGGPLVFMGGFHSSYPAQFGGDPKKGKEFFERALKLTGRRAHMVHLNYARLYAVTVNDKELFYSLLNEIFEAEDQGADVRLENKIARVHAKLLLAKANTLF